MLDDFGGGFETFAYVVGCCFASPPPIFLSVVSYLLDLGPCIPFMFLTLIYIPFLSPPRVCTHPIDNASSFTSFTPTSTRRLILFGSRPSLPGALSLISLPYSNTSLVQSYNTHHQIPFFLSTLPYIYVARMRTDLIQFFFCFLLWTNSSSFICFFLVYLLDAPFFFCLCSCGDGKLFLFI